ncbi:hypothetical protein DW241_10005 [Hungatella hathewayi]|nr:hypothetical protein DW241_10005 [Hungatella hathewayi]
MPLWGRNRKNSITYPFRAQMMQQSSAPCFCPLFFDKNKGYWGKKDKTNTAGEQENGKDSL